MRKWAAGFFICSVLGLFGLLGCSKAVEYSGESMSWSVECSIHPSANEKSYVIRYIGDAGQNIDTVSYSFESSHNFRAKGESKPQSTSLKIGGKSNLDAPYKEEAGFTLRMKWNDKEETIQLTKR
ncbi:hypothetical protein [Paenibacillus hamazuiensis]|uniref:hypothetical protein n=1 Tax=Paenibacillus hamazuiensis TaxID=2936508 RepID=UPI0020104B17|nr:hypothetical protein [Paenibacillus hamazuiensis]